MTEKRYYYRDYEELYYIFDSNTISEEEFDEKEEYEGYTAFEDSLSSEEIVDLLNENEHIKNTIKEAYKTERTAIGKSVLKQLLNNIGETNE